MKFRERMMLWQEISPPVMKWMLLGFIPPFTTFYLATVRHDDDLQKDAFEIAMVFLVPLGFACIVWVLGHRYRQMEKTALIEKMAARKSR